MGQPPFVNFLTRALFLRRRFSTFDRAHQHEHTEHEEHGAPDEVDVDAERHGFRTFDEAEHGKQRPDEGEHKANRPADIESHKFYLVNGF